MSAPSLEQGVSDVDFVIFPERWQVAEHTFRPPWYHTNLMSEFMGLIKGRYDAKPEGFEPGGMSLHSAMMPHGPDANAFEQASQGELTPSKLADTLAFMFESRLPQYPTPYAMTLETLQKDYADCWSGLRRRFDGGASMKLASLKSGRDGALVIVSRDLTRAVSAETIAPTLQSALDDWAQVSPKLEALARASRSRERSRASPFARRIAHRRCRAPINGRTARPMSIMSRWCARRAAPKCPKASGAIR